ncbi:MAG TPA: extracellular solute-binding protein [Candidatus Binatia bacterium]|jgi:iron(III) transport system substrate-binding protein|nr:extracellular solute-binding protein [Candidatus Binatia bacterium]
MKVLSLALLILATMSSFGWGQTKKPRTLDELAAYAGADRHQILLDGAKAEGKVVWYTSLSGVYRELVDAFKRKYPDIAVEVYRAGSTDLGPRLLNEAQAGRYVADALESTPGLLMLLRERGLLKAYTSPELSRYPDEAKTKADGARIYWVTDREAYLGFGYNTRQIAPAEIPKNFQDLLRPELKGKLAVTTESSTSRVVGTLIKYKGEEFVKRLRAQEIRLFKASSAGFLDLIAAGEVAGSFVVFQNQVTVKKEKKAPVDWVPLDGVPTNAGGSAIVANAPHPHAALLFTDFIIGAEGQKLMEQFRYGVAWKEYPFKREYPERGMSSAEYENAEDKWLQLTRSISKK